MTRGGGNKPTMLGRLIFGEKRKQHASPSRHRSATRNGGGAADMSIYGVRGGGGISHKNQINLHDWAIWRMHLNEQMGCGLSDRTDFKHMRQFLHSNPFYQQHSRDPSNGRYNGVRLLFSIPHARMKADLMDASHTGVGVAAGGGINKITNLDTEDTTTTYEQHNVAVNSDDHRTNSANSVSAGSPPVTHKSMSQVLPKALIGNKSSYHPVHPSIVTNDVPRARRSIRAPFKTVDRVHATLQKAVKDGNVLEKIKAFEMQAAAAHAESAAKLSGNSVFGCVSNNRMHFMASPIHSAAHRALSPTITHSIQHSISPMPIQYERTPPPPPQQPQQQQQQQHYIRSHRSRLIHPTRGHQDVSVGPMGGRQSRKGTHVLEPALGDIILRRRTPSQKTANDEDYSITAINSMPLPLPQGPSHRHHHHHHRASASRSRYRKETPHDRRTSSVHENVPKKSQPKLKTKQKQKQKETKPSASSKTTTRHRWLPGHKGTSVETEKIKQDVSNGKSNKNNKTKKKNTEQEEFDSKDQTKSSSAKSKKESSDNNRVYGVPNSSTVSEQSKFETISPQPPPRIDEENESDREEERLENKNHHTSPKPEENLSQDKKSDTNIERQSNKTEQHQKLSSADGEILSKVEDDNRFSRPTDDHAHRSELNDDDDECKSEGDVFIEESSLTNLNVPPQQPQSLVNVIRRYSSQCSDDKILLDRRWQWSKESGGLIDKGHPKKKQQKSTTSLTSKEDHTVYQTPKSEQILKSLHKKHASNKKQSILATAKTTSKVTSPPPNESNDEQSNTKQISKQILHAILNSMPNNQDQSTVNEFFENGPYTNPEDVMTNIVSTA